MVIKHRDHWHDVVIEDDGTLDTVVSVRGQDTGDPWTELRFSEADRRSDGSIKRSWIIELVSEACDDGSLGE